MYIHAMGDYVKSLLQDDFIQIVSTQSVLYDHFMMKKAKFVKKVGAKMKIYGFK